MLVKKQNSIKVINSKQCTVREYRITSKILSVATALINGRYPNQGRVTNRKCEATYYIISGSGTIHSEKGDFPIKKGELYFFEKREKYWIEGKKLFLFESNSPAWYPEQHKNIQ